MSNITTIQSSSIFFITFPPHKSWRIHHLWVSCRWWEWPGPEKRVGLVLERSEFSINGGGVLKSGFVGNGRKEPSSFGSHCHSSSASFAADLKCVCILITPILVVWSELKMEAFGTRELQPRIREKYGESSEIYNKILQNSSSNLFYYNSSLLMKIWIMK